MGRLNELIDGVTADLERYDAQSAGRAIEQFVDELSNWYVRLSRDRFWKAASDDDKASAYRTLYQCLAGVSMLLAPFVPFLAESLYQILVRSVDPSAPESVHLASWPAAHRAHVDRELLDEMRTVRTAVDLGRQARAVAKIKTRQPLAVAFVRARSKIDDEALKRFRHLVLDELNVKDVRVVGIDAAFIEYALRPNLPRLGPRYGKKIGSLRAALANADARAVAEAVAAGKTFEVSDNGEVFALEPDDVLVDSKSAQGFAFAETDGMLVALDTRLDRPLILEGIAREIVRNVQDARKAAGLDISDRIKLRVDTKKVDVSEALTDWRDYIAEQTLATEINSAAFESSYSASADDWSISLSKI
jgi:isoleucyl-tRNA synthetase